MAEITVTLKDGLKIGKDVLKDVVLRDPTAGDIIDSQGESERMVLTPDGPQLVVSPSLAGANMLRRQIIRIGNVQGPIDLNEIKRLSAHDLSLLEGAVSEMDEALVVENAAKELEKRGRTEGAEQQSAPNSPVSGASDSLA